MITVGGDRRVTTSIPRNNTNGTETNRGYVVYGPAVPEATVTLRNADNSTAQPLAADPAATPWGLRRIHDVFRVTSDTFTIELDTDTGDALDPNASDDDAVCRLNQGYEDFNNYGSPDFDNTAGLDRAGFENFVSVRQPAAGSGGTTGRYEQVIDASNLPDGYHYLIVRAFRDRSAGAEIWNEVRVPIYLDRAGPVVELEDPGTISGPQETFRVQADPTTTEVHMFWNLSPAVDPLTQINVFSRATQFARFTFDKNLDIGTADCGTLTIVALGRSGEASVTLLAVGPACFADVTTNGSSNGIRDCAVTLSDFSYYLSLWSISSPAADITLTGQCDITQNGDGVNLSDFSCYLAEWSNGCP